MTNLQRLAYYAEHVVLDCEESNCILNVSMGLRLGRHYAELRPHFRSMKDHRQLRFYIATFPKTRFWQDSLKPVNSAPFGFEKAEEVIGDVERHCSIWSTLKHLQQEIGFATGLVPMEA